MESRVGTKKETGYVIDDSMPVSQERCFGFKLNRCWDEVQ